MFDIGNMFYDSVSVFVRRVEPRHFYGELHYIKSVLLFIIIYASKMTSFTHMWYMTSRCVIRFVSHDVKGCDTIFYHMGVLASLTSAEWD